MYKLNYKKLQAIRFEVGTNWVLIRPGSKYIIIKIVNYCESINYGYNIRCWGKKKKFNGKRQDGRHRPQTGKKMRGKKNNKRDMKDGIPEVGSPSKERKKL